MLKEVREGFFDIVGGRVIVNLRGDETEIHNTKSRSSCHAGGSGILSQGNHLLILIRFDLYVIFDIVRVYKNDASWHV